MDYFASLNDGSPKRRTCEKTLGASACRGPDSDSCTREKCSHFSACVNGLLLKTIDHWGFSKNGVGGTGKAAVIPNGQLRKRE